MDIYWEANALADVNFSVDWVKKTLKPVIMKGTETSENEEFVLFCDNLSAQTNELFLQEVRKLNDIEWYGLAGATDNWHSIDCGFGHMLKSMVRTLQDEWLQSEDNIDLWLGNSEEKLGAKQRRILRTHWVGEAYKRLSGDSYGPSRYRCFEKTGCLITADGSGDDKIQHEGLPAYSVPPPLPAPGPENPMDLPPPETSINDEDLDENGDEDEDEYEDDLGLADNIDESERVDDVKDRIFDLEIMNRKLRAFYDEWHIGQVMWFNPKLGEFRVLFEDVSEVYIVSEDINGIDMVLLD